MPLAGGSSSVVNAQMYSLNSTSLQELAVNTTSSFVIDPFDNFIVASDSSTYAYPQSNVLGIAADDAGVYWIESPNTGANKIVRHAPSKLGDGNNTTLTSGFTLSDGITVYDGYVYWTTTNSVLRVPTGGGATETVASSQASPAGVAVDSSGVYWANRSSSGTIQHVTSPGANVQTLATGQNDPHGIALDANTVYWTNTAAGQVMKVAK
jgi:sugar lactone lactonase YvrE